MSVKMYINGKDFIEECAQIREEIKALREEVAELRDTAEPVAWISRRKGGKVSYLGYKPQPHETWVNIPLYTHPTPNAESERDAERYRFLINTNFWQEFEGINVRAKDNDEVNAEVDAAMEGKK